MEAVVEQEEPEVVVVARGAGAAPGSRRPANRRWQHQKSEKGEGAAWSTGGRELLGAFFSVEATHQEKNGGLGRVKKKGKRK